VFKGRPRKPKGTGVFEPGTPGIKPTNPV
jgi:hypothetical protein